MMEYYFAYGSNMDQEQMIKRCPSAVFIGKAVLKDHQIGFTRYSKSRDGGVADVLVNPGEEVWGILYTISKEDLLTAMENGNPRQIEPEDYERFEKVEAHLYEVLKPPVVYLDK